MKEVSIDEVFYFFKEFDKICKGCYIPSKHYEKLYSILDGRLIFDDLKGVYFKIK